MFQEYHNFIIELAAKKLARSLTEREINGIKNIHSFLMLEAVELELGCSEVSMETIEKTLEFYANKI